MSELAELLARMREVRGQVQEKLARVSSEQMALPAWTTERQVNVRYFFYRLVAHEVEHTVQLAQALYAYGISQSEAQRILGRLQATRGELEGLLIGVPDDALDRVPAPGQWSTRQVLEHLMEAEKRLLGRVEKALEKV